jgi:hypothetical protein
VRTGPRKAFTVNKLSKMPRPRTQSAAVSLAPTPRLALSIAEFCRSHGISEAFYYKLKKQREGPRVMKVGTRTLITLEAAAEWRRVREASTAEAIVSPRDPCSPVRPMAKKKDRREGRDGRGAMQGG